MFGNFLTFIINKTRILIMKQLFMAMAFAAALAQPVAVGAQAQAMLAAAPAAAAGQDDAAGQAGIEAYSDTSATDTGTYAASAPAGRTYSVNVSAGGVNHLFEDTSWIDQDLFGAFMILLLLFVIAPVAIIGLLCYFIYKSRKQKVRLAEMAMKNGRPIPDELIKPTLEPTEAVWRKGIKNVSLGLGLVCLFLIMDIDLGVGIGVLVAFCGAGQMVMARTSASRKAKGDKPAGDYEEKAD